MELLCMDRVHLTINLMAYFIFYEVVHYYQQKSHVCRHTTGDNMFFECEFGTRWTKQHREQIVPLKISHCYSRSRLPMSAAKLEIGHGVRTIILSPVYKSQNTVVWMHYASGPNCRSVNTVHNVHNGRWDLTLFIVLHFMSYIRPPPAAPHPSVQLFACVI